MELNPRILVALSFPRPRLACEEIRESETEFFFLRKKQIHRSRIFPHRRSQAESALSYHEQ